MSVKTSNNMGKNKNDGRTNQQEKSITYKSKD